MSDQTRDRETDEQTLDDFKRDAVETEMDAYRTLKYGVDELSGEYEATLDAVYAKAADCIRRHPRLKDEIADIVEEVIEDAKANVRGVLDGRFGATADVERELAEAKTELHHEHEVEEFIEKIDGWRERYWLPKTQPLVGPERADAEKAFFDLVYDTANDYAFSDTRLQYKLARSLEARHDLIRPLLSPRHQKSNLGSVFMDAVADHRADVQIAEEQAHGR